MTDEWTQERIAELREQLAAGDDGWSADLHPSEVVSILDALESAREERDGFKEAYEDVMGALSAALDGDDEYNQRPAEVAWRLRDDRDRWKEEAGR